MAETIKYSFLSGSFNVSYNFRKPIFVLFLSLADLLKHRGRGFKNKNFLASLSSVTAHFRKEISWNFVIAAVVILISVKVFLYVDVYVNLKSLQSRRALLGPFSG